MSLSEKIEAKFQELLVTGQEILQKHYNPHGKFGYGVWDAQPSESEFQQWYTSVRNLIEKVCGEHTAYYGQIVELYNKEQKNFGCLPACEGVLQSAYNDWKAGFLEDTKALITADVFSDFIEQAEYLLEEGHKLPSAVLVRAVLEDGLRTLCKKNGISLPDKPKLDWMNAELTKAGVYNKNMQKQVTAWAGIGNSAAHGKPDEFTDTDVKNMISGVIGFNATYLK